MGIRPHIACGALLLCFSAVRAGNPPHVKFSGFTQSCERSLDAPLERFWGSRPLPDYNMVRAKLSKSDDPNLAILPKWDPPGKLSLPSADTLIAVRFLGGVSNYSAAVQPGCVDWAHVWCDLVTRAANGSLMSRFDLVNSRLDRWVQNGIDLMIVLDNVPWAFVNVTHEACSRYGCQYLPPGNPQEFADWVGELANHVKQSYGIEYASRIRWRLGTEANGPRWSNYGEYYQTYLDTYNFTMRSIQAVIPKAAVGASNWVGVHGHFTSNGSDAFQWNFYGAVAKDASMPLDWISVSHYGLGFSHYGFFPYDANFPGADFVPRTPFGNRGALELQEMRKRAERPKASLEVMEWGPLFNEQHQSTDEPSSVGAAWSATSVTCWMCNGVDRIFHWGDGSKIRNSTGDNRLVRFYESWSWAMALLELFIGGTGRFMTYDSSISSSSLNRSVAVIESIQQHASYAMVSAVGANRVDSFRTWVPLDLDASSLGDGPLIVEEYRMDSSRSIVETVIRDLAQTPAAFQHPASRLPAEFSELLTPIGLQYVQQPENMERYWQTNVENFQPHPLDGTWNRSANGHVQLHVRVDAFTVVMVAIRGTAGSANVENIMI